MKKFHPIFFNSEMVEALLNDAKTQTRRKFKEDFKDCSESHKLYTQTEWKNDPLTFSKDGLRHGRAYCSICGNGVKISNDFFGLKCPYGEIGDIMWVRETWQAVYLVYDYESGLCDEIIEEPDVKKVSKYVSENHWYKGIYDFVYKANSGFEEQFEDRGFRWRPSIHMPKAACRIFLEITDIRVERLQDISEEDAVKEGVPSFDEDLTIEQRFNNYNNPSNRVYGSKKLGFKWFWQELYGIESFNENPWVWVIDFKKVDRPKNFLD